MATRQIILATITGAIVLFLFDGAFQAIPNFGVRAVERIETTDFTTAKFSELTNRMAYIATDKTVSFVATRQIGFYNLSKFFAVEFLSAFLIALLFAFVFVKIRFNSLKDRLLLTTAFAIIASFAIHIPYLNWWGFSLAYTIGVVFKTVLGWMLIAFIQNRFIFKIK